MSKRTHAQGLYQTPIREDPPAPTPGGRGGGASQFDAQVEVLQEEPGVWMKVRTYRSREGATPYSVRGCEVKVVACPDGGFDIYARWPATS